jgi:hypothetical protein
MGFAGSSGERGITTLAACGDMQLDPRTPLRPGTPPDQGIDLSCRPAQNHRDAEPAAAHSRAGGTVFLASRVHAIQAPRQAHPRDRTPSRSIT